MTEASLSEGYGPVDLYLLGLPDELPDPSSMAALMKLVDEGAFRVLDLVVIARDDHGETSFIEAADLVGFDLDQFGATGLVGHEDIVGLATGIPRGTSALVIAVELLYHRELSRRVAQSGATLLAYERIPAPVVNALAASLSIDLEY